MTEPIREEDAPWARLASLLAIGEVTAVRDFLERLAPDEIARAITRLSGEHQQALMQLLQNAEAAELLEELPEAQAATMIEDLSAEDAAGIVGEMPGESQAELLREVGQEGTKAILQEMDAAVSDHIRERIEYEPESAGALMSERFLTFLEDESVGAALRDLEAHKERYADFHVQYLYVVGNRDDLRGVLRIRDLLLAPREQKLADLMIPDPVALSTGDGLEVVATMFERHPFLGLPVIDDDARLAGVVLRSAVQEARARRARKTFLKLSGIIGGDELRSLPLRSRSLRRLAFLCPNIALNLIAASVIALYQDTIQAVIALAVFLPIISDMSGCSGNQAVAVSIRELSLGLIQPREFWRVFVKEGAIGLINGTVVGLLLGLVAFLWQDNIVLGAVVGGALALNTLLSVVLGGLVPLFLKRCGADPALASAPILTTVTDMCGFFLVLNFASILLSRLT